MGWGSTGVKEGGLKLFKIEIYTYIGRGQGGVSEHENKICVRQGKGVGGLEGSQGGGD